MGDSAPTAEERDVDRKLLAWKEQESIAMHFNDLIARFRVQALGGTATIGAAAALVTSKTEANPWTFVALVAFLFVSWTALWLLDYGYYQKLLSGSVKTLMILEAELPAWSRVSTNIEHGFVWAHHGHFWFYALIQIALGAVLDAAIYDAAKEAKLLFWLTAVCWVAWTCLAMVVAGPSTETRERTAQRRAARNKARAEKKQQAQAAKDHATRVAAAEKIARRSR